MCDLFFSPALRLILDIVLFFSSRIGIIGKYASGWLMWHGILELVGYDSWVRVMRIMVTRRTVSIQITISVPSFGPGRPELI